MIISGALVRLLPHPPNFTPIGAMALFAGAQFATRRAAFVLPLGALLLSDLVYEALFGWGIHSGMIFVYPSFAAIVLLGRTVRQHRRSVLAIGAAAFAGSVLFFLVTNLGVWLLGGLYPRDAAGLLACYVAALPFFGPLAAGDLLYSGMLFGGLAALERRFPRLTPATEAGAS
jgi:hypothetical protein